MKNLNLIASDILKNAVIRKCPKKDQDKRPKKDQQWCLYTKDKSRLLGRHPSIEKAKQQEKAVQYFKHKGNDMTTSKNAIDLSKKEKTFSNYIATNSAFLSKKNLTVKDLVDFVKDCKKTCHVSDQYLEKVLERMEQINSVKGIVKYLYDAMLKGSELGVISSIETQRSLKKIFGTDESIIKTIANY
jgi:hypothetical protein